MVDKNDGKACLSPFHHSAAGAVSGFVSRVAVQPFDVVKIRQQLQSTRHATMVASRDMKYRHVFRSLHMISMEEGVRALWKGLVPAQLMSVTFGAVQFVSFEKLRSVILSRRHGSVHLTKNIYPVIDFICGGLGGVLATVACQPLDTLRTRFIAQGREKVYRGLLHGCVCMVKEGGIKTFFKGVIPAMISVFPLTGMQFCFYGLLSHLWALVFDHNEVTGFRSLFCGGVAGAASKVLLLPLDITRKRLQIQGFVNVRVSYISFEPYKGFRDCMKRIVMEEGYLALFKGAKASIIKASLLVSLTFYGYEETCKVIAYHIQNKDDIVNTD